MTAVSIVIPLYNKAATIERAVRSVLDQTYDDFELIVVDDGSTDGSREQLAGIDDPRVRLVTQANAGPGAARNHGASLGSAPLIAFLDADDRWRPGHLELACSVLDGDPSIDVFVSAYDTGRFEAIQPSLVRTVMPVSGILPLSPDMSAEEIKLRVDAAQPSCVVIRRAVFERFGGFYDRDRCTYGEDSYLMMRPILFGRTYFSRDQQVEFNLEHSALGFGRVGDKPRHPALIEPAPLRQAAHGDRAVLLDRILGFYRFRETQALARKGRWREIVELRRRFPWPEFPGWSLFLLDRKLELRCLLATVTGR